MTLENKLYATILSDAPYGSQGSLLVKLCPRYDFVASHIHAINTKMGEHLAVTAG